MNGQQKHQVTLMDHVRVEVDVAMIKTHIIQVIVLDLQLLM